MGVGLAHADVLNTVSPTHAQEILTPERGYGFEGLLQAQHAAGRLTGILNGLDLAAWDPAKDKALPARFDAGRLARRAVNKRRLQMELGLPVAARAPLLAMVTRLDTQKGLEIALPALRTLMRGEPAAQAVVLGTGLAALEQATKALAREFPDQARAVLRFDAGLARRLYGGADLVLVPSLYEPCGLTQMIALRYGAVPVARRTGGLADTVIDADEGRGGNGFVFSDYNAGALLEAMQRALKVYRRPARWQALQRRGLRQALRLGWEGPAKAYAALYQQAVTRRKEAVERLAAARAGLAEAG
jgi:starch synthase